jgi:endonuclease/exonuclease/phosphatase family metal-dependent hydrolase
MKRFTILFFSLLLLATSCYQKQQLDYSQWYTREEDEDLPSESVEGLMIMSSNVRFYSARNKASDPDVGDRDWEVRKVGYFHMVNTMQPMVIGLQEAEMNQVADIISNCKGYSYVGVGRTDGAQKGESTAILYKTALIQMEEYGTVWLSDTPDVVASYFPEMADKQSRTATWAILTVKESGRRFFYLNTHLSLSSASQPKEVQVVLNTVAAKCPAGLPVVLSADWNLEEDDPILAPILAQYTSARQVAPLTDNSITFHWWGDKNTIAKNEHLDHIFFSGFESCLRFRTLTMKWKGYWISDHHPVYAIFQFKTGSTEKQKPVADFEIPANPMMDEAIKFTDKSTSEDGIELWEWNIGGILSSEQNPEVVFNTFGDDIPVSLTVTDHYGQKASVSKTFSVARSDGHDLTIAWSKSYDTTPEAWVNWTSPALNVAGDRIYVTSSGNHLVCFDPSGAVIGSYNIGENDPYNGNMQAVRTTPSVDTDGTVYIPVQYGWSDEGHSGVYSIKPDCAGKNWYCNTGPKAQYEYAIAAHVGDYVAVLMRGCGGDITGNMSLIKKSDGKEYTSLTCDGGSYGGIAVAKNNRIVYSAITVASTGLGTGYKVAIPNGDTWVTSDNNNAGRRTNLLSGDGIEAKGCQPALSSKDGSVYLCASAASGKKMACARYDLNSYAHGSSPTPIWRVEVPADFPAHWYDETPYKHGIGFGCALDEQGNAYYMAGDKVFRLNKSNGEKAWEHSFTKGSIGVPAIDSMGYLYFLDEKAHKLVKLSTADGKVITELPLGDDVSASSCPTIAPDGSIYFNANVSEVPTLYKVTCPKTTAPGSNWSQLGGNPQKTCNPQ